MSAKETAKGVQVNTTLPKKLYDLLEDHRWDVRKTMTELVRHALEEYAKSQGLVLEDAGPDDDASAEPAEESPAAAALEDDAAAKTPVKASTKKA